MANKRLYLKTDEFLTVGDYLVSKNELFFAIMQRDGNFCVYKGTGPEDNRGALWCSMKHPGEGQYFAIMQRDGNFCVYKGTDPMNRRDAVWCSMKHPGEGQYFAIVQDDGNFCVYRGTGPEDRGDAVWGSMHVDPVAKVGMNKFEDRFRSLHLYAQKNGFEGAFPTFMEEPSEEGKVYGALLLKKEAAEFRNISANELGNPDTPQKRFQALFDYVQKNAQEDFGGAIPTFTEEGSGQGKAFGALLLKKEAAEFRNISANELGNPDTPQKRFQALFSYAHKNGFEGSFPTFLEEDSGEGKVYGAWLINKDYSVPRNILFYDLLKLLIRPGDIIYGNIKNQFPGHIALIVRNENNKGEEDLIVREAFPEHGVSNISLKDFCECGGYHKTSIFAKEERYDDIRILRAKCTQEQAEQAAIKAKEAKGEYDWSYATDVIGFFGSLTIGAFVPLLLFYTTTAAIAFALAMQANWDNEKKWYCSKLVYLAYRRAGFDLYPKKGKCVSPLAALKGEYPYLYDKRSPYKLLFNGKCPWCVISPDHILKSERVQKIWDWKK